MTRPKRGPLRSANFGAAASRACAENFTQDYYIIFRRKIKPKSGQGRRFSSVSWEFALTIIGAAWLVARFARLIDWMER